jgi:transketolase
MRIAENASNSHPDIFIMSKGHGYLAQLVILESLGILPKKHLDEYCTPHGLIGAHPDLGIPGIQAATGSLGHGLGMALGMAIAERNYARREKRSAARIYCLISDGELQEGSTWEAIILAGSIELENLYVIVDNNDFQSLGRTSETHSSLYPIESKFESFKFHAVNVDGHEFHEINKGFDLLDSKSLPKAIIARTTKGKGVSFMENVPIWHYRSPNKEEFLTATQELEIRSTS